MQVGVEEYKRKLESLPRYNSFQEKEAVLACLDDDKPSFIKIANILGTTPVSEAEAEAFIFTQRKKSVSEEINVTATCTECDHFDTFGLDIDSAFFKGTLSEKIPVGLYDSLDQIDEENINNISIPEYNELEKELLQNNKSIFDPNFTVLCRRCGTKFNTTVDTYKIISKFSAANLYSQYVDLSYYSHVTKSDVDNMWPFEREIFIGLIQEKEDNK